MRVALEVWTGDAAEAVDLARHAEMVGIDAFYLGESPTPLNSETWTTLAAIATATTTIRLGPVITNVLPAYRHPLLLARQAASVARLSDGRLDFRTGVGAAPRFARSWWEPQGVAYPSYGERARLLDETLDDLRRLWTPGPEGIGLPHPPIPITMAASSPASRALAARHAARWETSFCTRSEWLDRLAVAPADLANSLEIDGFVAPDETSLERLLQTVRTDRSAEAFEPILDRALVGTEESVAPALTAHRNAGVDQLLVALHDPTDRVAISTLGAAVHRSRDGALPYS